MPCWRQSEGTAARRRSHVAFLLAVLFLSFFLCQCTAELREKLQKTRGSAVEKPVQFIYKNGKARKVCIAGSFNQWSTDTDCMARSGRTWTLNMKLPPGRYEYVFIINGKNWEPDPKAALSEKTGFGSKTKNSVLIVE